MLISKEELLHEIAELRYELNRCKKQNEYLTLQNEGYKKKFNNLTYNKRKKYNKEIHPDGKIGRIKCK